MRYHALGEAVVLIATLFTQTVAAVPGNRVSQLSRKAPASLPNGDPINCGPNVPVTTPCWNTQNVSYVDWCLQIDTGIAVVNNTDWRLQCRTDYYEQNIFAYPAPEVSHCFSTCLAWNVAEWSPPCVAWVFDAYSVVDGISATNCWLKGGVDNIETNENITQPLVAASLVTVSSDVTGSPIVTLYFDPSPMPSIMAANGMPVSASTTTTASGLASLTPSTASGFVQRTAVPAEHAKHRRSSDLAVVNSAHLGASRDSPTQQYVQHNLYNVAKLDMKLLQPGVDMEIVNDYPLSSDTGTWTVANAPTQNLSDMTLTPRLARDGGRGGSVNGTQVFLFCDTSTYGDTDSISMGYFNGMVSSSVAVDESMNALTGGALELVDTVGQWQDNVGRARGFSPMTTAEQAYNTALSGRGYRYAVWPDSSPTPLNTTHSILYAPLVYLTIDMNDLENHPNFTSLGNTLLLIHTDPVFGPHADRLKNQLFTQNEISWGSLGGFRAWTSAGPGTNDGDVYVFGQAGGTPIGGVMVAKVPVQNITDRTQYLYWIGDSWSTEMPPLLSSSNAFMISGNIMDLDVIYSPYHRTFIMIYMIEDTDNKIYYRHMVGNNNATQDILPPYEQGGDDNYAEQLLLGSWSEQQVLLDIPAPERGYAYAGGLHAGYFGKDDITQGGKKMLVTWTEHTAVDPSVPNSGYALKAQIIELDWS